MRGVINEYKDAIVKELCKGVPSSKLSQKYGVAMSTITTWIKELPADVQQSKFAYRNKRISVMRKVNQAEALITDKISEYVVCDISDEEWVELQQFIQQQLIAVATFDNRDEEQSLCNGCLYSQFLPQRT